MAQFTKYTGTIAATAGQLITALDAALVTGQGWDNTFTGGGANKKIYRPLAGNRYYFRVDDGGTGTGGAKEALIRGAETWTDIDTPNLNPFPSDAQSALTAHSLIVRKGVDGTPRNYIIYADDRTAIMFIKSEATTWYQGPIYFGDFYSFNSTPDSYRTCLLARASENSASGAIEPFGAALIANISAFSATPGHFMARNYLGTGTSATAMRMSDPKFQGLQPIQGYLTVPNGPNGGVYLSRQHIIESTSAITQYRGRLRGVWAWCHLTATFADGDTFSGLGELAGKTFAFINPFVNAATSNAICIETSNTLETN